MVLFWSGLGCFHVWVKEGVLLWMNGAVLLNSWIFGVGIRGYSGLWVTSYLLFQIDIWVWCWGLFRVRGVTYLLLQGHDGVYPDRALLTGICDPHRSGQEKPGRQQLEASPGGPRNKRCSYQLFLIITRHLLGDRKCKV